MLSAWSMAQNMSLKDRFFYGGNLGLQFGSVTFIDVSPMVGFWFTNELSAGVGAIYNYAKYSNYNPAIERQLYGGNVFARLDIFSNLFLHAQYEPINVEYFDLSGKKSRKWVENTLVGGGYKQAVGKRSCLTISVLWNLTQSEDSPYQNPIIRAGFNF